MTRPDRAAALAVVLLALVLPGRALAQATPQGCGYGTGGPNATTLCWIDMSGYVDATARSAGGQAMTVRLPGGYTISFTITSRGTPTDAQRAVSPTALPNNGAASYLGNLAYQNTPGKPALYTAPGTGAMTTTLTLSNIQVRDAAGQTVGGYAFVGADAENTNSAEGITWTSDTPIYEVARLSPFTGANGCQNTVTGLGTTTVSCSGNSDGRTPYGTEIVAANAPTTFSQALYDGWAGSREAVAFAIMTSKIQVTKTVVGRVRASDSFDVAATSPEGSTLGSASTGGASSATTGSLTVLPRTDGSPYTFAEAVTPGSGTRLADYSQSWSCTNNGAADPSLPASTGLTKAVAPGPGDDIQCTVTNTQLQADLAIVKTADPSPAVPGTNVTYTLRVTNNGPSRATNARITDPLPSGLSFVSASAPCGEAGGTVTCPVGTLDPGASQTFTVTTKIASSARTCAQLTNTASVSSDTPDAAPTNNSSALCVPIRGVSGLSISKTPSTDEVPIGGGQVMYTLVVRNAGPSDATGVKLSDPMAPGLTLVAADPSQGSCSTSGGKVSCELGDLAADGSAQVVVTAQTWATPGAIVNTATVKGDQDDPNPADNSASATVTVPPPATPESPPAPPSLPPPAPTSFDLAVTKTENHRTVWVGQRVTYRIVVANKGPSAAPGVEATDTLSWPASLVSVKTSAGSCAKALPMRCSLGTIAAGAKVAITVVAAPRRAGCKQRNAVSATGEGTDANPADNLDTVDLCARRVALRLTKVADQARVRAGGLMGYTLRVTNPTRATARNVKTCDRLPSGLVYVSSRSKAKLSGGAYCWTAGTLGAGASRRYRITVRVLRGASGSTVNGATVDGSQARPRKARAAIRVLPSRAQGGGVTG